MKQTVGDIIILHKCTINNNHMMYIWFLRYEARQAEFFVILGHFLPFYPSNSPKNQNLQKMKKTLGDIIILHMHTKNYERTEKVTYRHWYPN